MITRMPVKRRSQPQKGSAMVELALCLMGFLLLTIGSMEFGWGIYAYNFCAYAAQDGARWASVRGSGSTSPASVTDIQAYVQSEAVGLTTSLITTTPTWSAPPTTGNPTPTQYTTPTGYNTPGNVVTVTVYYTIVPLAGLAIKQNILVSSTAQFYINN
jgi:Flp pilus assembly protein TadG